VSRLDLGFRLNFRICGHVACFGAVVVGILNGFKPAYETELLLWMSICFFAWDTKRERGIK